MTIYYYIISAIIAIAVLSLAILTKRTFSNKFPIVLKVLSLVLFVAFFFRYMWDSDNITQMHNLPLGFGFQMKQMIVVAAFQVWLMYLMNLLLILYPFFKIKLLDSVIATFGVLSYIFNFSLLYNQIIAITGAGPLSEFSFRAALLAIETGIGLGYCLAILLCKTDVFKLKGKIKDFAFCILGLIFCSFPIFLPQLFGNASEFRVEAIDLNLQHRLFIYPMFIIPVVMYLVFRKKSMDVKRFAVLFYAFSTLLQYMIWRKFPQLQSIWNWPLHLCNTALFVTPLCVLFRLKKLFYFTYFINVLGAFLAIIMPNYTDYRLILAGTIGFFVDHYQSFFAPLVVVALGIFERPRLKEFKYSMIGFAVYFVGILFTNAWVSNYNSSVDFFFLNSNFIVSKFPPEVAKIMDVQISFDIGELHFRFYILYQALFFLVYVVAAFGMWFIYENGFAISEKLNTLFERKKKIRLDELILKKAGTGSLHKPIYKDEIDMLKIENFSKRYGSSKNFAVENASLEVFGGEIFGFLGPNGSGKSTIIKSLVGLQPMTSGSMHVCGFDVTHQSIETKKLIGFVPDHYALYEKLTGREYINYIADLYEISKADRDQRINHFLEMFELAHAFDNQMKTYSHGMKQKIAIMAALVHNPKIWILDEPMTGLDPNSIFQVKETMKEHARQGNIVFFSSHIMDVVERICDRIAIIRKGKVICTEKVSDIEAAGFDLEKYFMSTIETGTPPSLKTETTQSAKKVAPQKTVKKNEA